jgi:hypothetical protein
MKCPHCGCEITERKGSRPTLEEVAAYCKERGNDVDPAKWIAHYESNGWRVGRVPMKDWRAAVRTWERTDIGGNGKVKPRSAICSKCGAGGSMVYLQSGALCAACYRAAR